MANKVKLLSLSPPALLRTHKICSLHFKLLEPRGRSLERERERKKERTNYTKEYRERERARHTKRKIDRDVQKESDEWMKRERRNELFTRVKTFEEKDL